MALHSFSIIFLWSIFFFFMVYKYMYIKLVRTNKLHLIFIHKLEHHSQVLVHLDLNV